MVPDRRATFGAIVLAGGRGSRMGDGIAKPLLDLAGRPLIAHVVDRLSNVEPIVLSAPDDGTYNAFGDLVAPDRRTGFQGPLAGIEAGLICLQEEAPHLTHALVVPADTPFLPPDLADRLSPMMTDTRIVIAECAGRLHVSVALWPIALVSTLTDWLDDDRSKALRAFQGHVGYRICPFPSDAAAPGGDPFANINTPDELARAREWIASR